MGKQKSASRKTKDACKKYGIAITNYVLGEDLGMSPEELYNHLRSCPQCLEELTDWQETYAVMRTEAYHKTPEAKKRYAELLEKIKNLPASPGEQPIDTKWDVSSAAGKIYDCLKTTGKISRQTLREKTGLINYPFYEAIGWLVCQEKVLMSKDEQTVYVSLTEQEREAGLR